MATKSESILECAQIVTEAGLNGECGPEFQNHGIFHFSEQENGENICGCCKFFYGQYHYIEEEWYNVFKIKDLNSLV